MLCMTLNSVLLYPLLAFLQKNSNNSCLSITLNGKDYEAGYQVTCADLVTDLLHDINLVGSKLNTNKYNLASLQNLQYEVIDDIKTLKIQPTSDYSKVS